MSSSLTPQDFLSPEKITLTTEEGGYSFSTDELEQTLDSFSLSGGGDDAFGIPNLTYTLTAAIATAGTGSGDTTPPPSGATITYYYNWAKGVKTSNFVITGGYYDANKVAPYAGGVDCYMCWAGAASNLIAWWQTAYNANSHIASNVPTSAQNIFTRLKTYWTNTGGFVEQGVSWWLAGNSTLYLYSNRDQSRIKSTYKNSSTGGYYKSLYNASGAAAIMKATYLENSSNTSAVYVASELASAFNRGAGISISVTKYSNGDSHSLSLWGIKRNSSGQLLTLYLTDSNDGNKGLLSINVSYDSSRSRYKLTHGDYKGWHLTAYQFLEAFNYSNYSVPASAKVTQSGKYVTFKWTNKSKGSNISHQIAYKRKGASSFTYITTSKQSYKIALPKEGTYEWRVRTKVGTAFTSDWVKAGTFTFTGLPPKITMYSITNTKQRTNKSKIGIGWKSNEYATFKLVLDGKQVYSGSGTNISRRYYILADGTYSYKLIATDKYGNKSYKSGTILCDTFAPSNPTSLRARLTSQNTVTLSWGASMDANPFYYEVWIKTSVSSGYDKYKVNTTSLGLILNVTGTWQWRVRAVDGSGHASRWVNGARFNNNYATAALPDKPTFQLPDFSHALAAAQQPVNPETPQLADQNGALPVLDAAAEGNNTPQALAAGVSTTPTAAASDSLDTQLALSAGDLCLLSSADYSNGGSSACAALLEDAAALEEKRNAALAATA